MSVIYDKHDKEWDKCLSDNEHHKISLTWLENKNTLDRWRHNRMYQLVQPIIDSSNNYSWLTVGDGRYGTDAHALQNFGAKDVTCTDMSDTLLKIGHASGFISKFAEENAENLSFNDDNFDFTFCKEAYHHFPRPQIALQEMLRVSKVGVVLIEPRDAVIDSSPISIFLSFLRRLLGKKSYMQHFFEPVGNYVFSISEREMEKIQLGMHRQHLAFYGLNDSYRDGIEFTDLDSTLLKEKFVIFKIRSTIKFKNLLCRLGLLKSDLLAVILFKSVPSNELLTSMQQHGWSFSVLPDNPYV